MVIILFRLYRRVSVERAVVHHALLHSPQQFPVRVKKETQAESGLGGPEKAAFGTS